MGSEPEAVRRNRELQRSLYGEPLGDRLRRVLAALEISQARLAQTLGVSPAMVSQLISGRRAKIGTSVVLGRLVLLEGRLAAAVAVRDDPRALAELLDGVRDARPRFDVGFDVGFAVGYGDAMAGSTAVPAPRVPVGSVDELAGVRAVAEAEELRRAAEVLDPTSPSLAAFLRRAAR